MSNVWVVEDGYGDTKYIGNGSAKYISSYVTPFKPKPSNEFNLLDTVNNSEYVASEVRGERYTIGDYAAKLDPNIQWIGGENKHADKRFPILYKTVLGMMCDQPYENVDMLAMNLPIKHDTKDRREFLTNIAQGSHELLVSYDGENFHKRNIYVKDVIIKKQSFGSFCYQILNQNGELKNKEMASGFNIVVDIGARTLNVLTIDAMNEQPELTTHTNDGMFQAYFQVADFLKNEHDIVIPDGKLQQVINNGEIKNIDINPLIRIAYQNHANTIVSILEKMFINTWSFVTSITFTGGGSHLLKPYLKDVFDKRDIETHYLDRYANAIGLKYYALRQLEKNRSKDKLTVRIGYDG